MTQAEAEPKVYSFDQFISWYPENSEVRYELQDGVIIEMPKPKGNNSDLTGSLIEQLLIAIRQMGKGGIWTIPRESIVKLTGDKSGYEPDIIVLNKDITAVCSVMRYIVDPPKSPLKRGTFMYCTS